MEATGRDGGRGRGFRSYREQTRTSSSYTISSTSGTVSSTGYASNGSHLSWISMEAARHFQEMEEEGADEFVQPVKKIRKEMEKLYRLSLQEKLRSVQMDYWEDELSQLAKELFGTPPAEEAKMKQIKSLAKEFFGAASANCCNKGADMSVLDKWFEKLGVGWVLHIADGAAAGRLEQPLDVSSWIQALGEIGDALTASLSSPAEKEGPAAEESEHDQQDIMTDQVQFASFTQQALLKMLDFVDLIDAPNLDITCDVSTIHLVPIPYQKLYTMLCVHNALFIELPSPRPSAQVGGIQQEVARLLSAKKHKASEAIWNTMEEIRNGILESVGDGDDSSSGTPTSQGSADIHKAIRSVIGYIRFLPTSLYPIVSEAVSLGKYVPQIGDLVPLESLVVDMMSCIQEKLVSKSEKFPDQSLRFLFLLNNSSFIRDQIHYCNYFPESYKASFSGKIEGYMDSYMQVSWAPVLECLFHPKSLRSFGKNCSIMLKVFEKPTLLKFESEFQKTYTTQKLWKVPDPQLRKTLREAIIVKIVPSYTKYIEDNNVTTPKFTPQNLEEMLQELFEG